MANDKDAMSIAGSARASAGPTKEDMGRIIMELQQKLEMAEAKLAKKVAFNAPETYKGERGKLNNFLGQVELFMANYPTGALTETGKVMLAASYLRDRAFEWFEPYMKEWTES